MMSPAEKLTRGVAAAKRWRWRWWQFSLRGLLLAIIACSVFFAWLGGDLRQAVRQKRAVDALRALGADVKCFNIRPTRFDRLIEFVLGREAASSKQFVFWNTSRLPDGALTDAEVALLGELRSVEWLDLSGPQITDACLVPIARCADLEFLHVTGSRRVTSAGVKALLPLADRLISLELLDTSVDDAAVDTLVNFRQLVDINLRGTLVTGKSLPRLVGRRFLSSLLITRVTDADLATIDHQWFPRCFACDGTELTGVGLAKLKSLTPKHTWIVAGQDQPERLLGPSAVEPEVILITNHRLTDAELPAILAPTDVELIITDSDITDAGVEILAQHPAIEFLDLSNSQITDAGMVHLARLPQLKSLRVAGTRVTEQGVLELRELVQLRKIDLTGTDLQKGDGGRNARRDVGWGVSTFQILAEFHVALIRPLDIFSHGSRQNVGRGTTAELLTLGCSAIHTLRT